MPWAMCKSCPFRASFSIVWIILKFLRFPALLICEFNEPFNNNTICLGIHIDFCTVRQTYWLYQLLRSAKIVIISQSSKYFINISVFFYDLFRMLMSLLHFIPCNLHRSQGITLSQKNTKSIKNNTHNQTIDLYVSFQSRNRVQKARL